MSSTPALGDIDGDGDLDLMSGEVNGTFLYFESFVVQSPPAVEITGALNPLAGFDVGSLAAPGFADLDGDGDADLVAGEDFGTFRYFENTGSATNPKFAARTGAANPLNGCDVGDSAYPALGDLDSDDDFDLLSGRLAGDFSYYQNTGNAKTPLFAAPVANPFDLHIVGSDTSAPTLADMDQDGDLDLVVGQYYGDFVFFQNTGTRTNPSFYTPPVNLFGEFPFAYEAPAFGDFDGDGDQDVVTGLASGKFLYLQKPSTSLYLRLTGAANPLDGADVGQRSAPTAVDLDGDGGADLVTGAGDGTFRVHYFPEPARGLLLGAGIALLRGLARRRSRTAS